MHSAILGLLLIYNPAHSGPSRCTPPHGRGPSPRGRCSPSCGTWHRRTPPQEPRRKSPGTSTPGRPARITPGAGPGTASQWHPRRGAQPRGYPPTAPRQEGTPLPTDGHGPGRPARLPVAVERRGGATAAGPLGPPDVVFAHRHPGPCHSSRQGGFPAAAPPRRGSALQPAGGGGLGTFEGRGRAPEPLFPPGPGPGATPRRWGPWNGRRSCPARRAGGSLRPPHSPCDCRRRATASYGRSPPWPPNTPLRGTYGGPC